MELLGAGIWWVLFLGGLLAVVVTGVMAAGVSYSRLESIAVDMSPDYDSLSQAGEAMPYQPLSRTGFFQRLAQMFKPDGASTPNR